MHKVSGLSWRDLDQGKSMFYLGIDVSKLKLDCMLLFPETDKRKSKVVPNTSAGIKTLVAWCAKQGAAVEQIHGLMEATGPYHEQAATQLFDAGMGVSILNPAQVHDFAKALAVRSKTDALDSLVLARYGAVLKPALWQPPPAHVRELRALLSQLDALTKDRARVANRQEKIQASGAPLLVESSVENTLDFYLVEIQRLEKAINHHIDRHPDLKQDSEMLETIPGVGTKVSRAMMTVMHTHRFSSAEALAAYLGLVPVQRQSGTSLKGRSRLSKTGRADLRAVLYMAGIVAAQHNPHVRALYQRLLGAGKAKMAAIGACMRKLVHLCFGVFKNKMPYCPNYASCP